MDKVNDLASDEMSRMWPRRMVHYRQVERDMPPVWEFEHLHYGAMPEEAEDRKGARCRII